MGTSRNMQNCFREHPDIYGAELDDDETEAALEREQSGSEAHNASDADSTPSSPAASKGEKVADGPDHPAEVQGKRQRSQAATEQVKAQHGEPTSESDEVVPKAWHDEK